MRRSRRGGGFHQEFGGSGEDSFVAVVVTKLTGALLFILLLTMVIMVLVPKADSATSTVAAKEEKTPSLMLEVPETLPEATLNRAYAYAFAARGGSTGVLTWTIVEALPQGLAFDEKTGRLSGQITDKALKSVPLTIQATDGKTVAGAVTVLPVWNPEQDGQALALNQPLERMEKLAAMPMQAWLSQGFGLGLIWFGHLAGVGVIDRLERVRQLGSVEGESPGTGRFRWYRRIIFLASASCSVLMIYMVYFV